MATIILGAVGTAIGSGFGGAVLGFSGAAIGGMIVDAGTFEFDRERYPLLFDPAPDGRPYAEAFGADAFLARLRMRVLMNLGGCMAPFNAWLLLRGLERRAHVGLGRRGLLPLTLRRPGEQDDRGEVERLAEPLEQGGDGVTALQHAAGEGTERVGLGSRP